MVLHAEPGREWRWILGRSREPTLYTSGRMTHAVEVTGGSLTATLDTAKVPFGSLIDAEIRYPAHHRREPLAAGYAALAM